MIKKTFTQMAVAQIVSAMTANLCLLIDSIMIGRYLGASSLAAYGLASPLILLFAAIGGMISAGIQVICGKAIGKNDKEGTNAAFSIAVILIICISAFALFFIGFFNRQATLLLGAGSSGELYHLTRTYLIGFIIGSPAMLASFILAPFLQLSGKQNVLIMAVLMMTIGDIIFDLLDVFVFHGAMFGMGLASSVSYYVASIVGLSYFVSKKCQYKFKLKLITFAKTKELLRAGVPSVINMVSLVLLSYSINNLLLNISETPKISVASYSIIATISNICYSFSSGIASVSLMLSGIYFHEKNKDSLYELMRLMIRSAIIIDIIITAVVLVFSPALVQVFMKDGEMRVARVATYGLRLFVLSMIPSALNTCLKHYYQGITRVHLAEFLSFLQNFACIALFAVIMSFFLGVTGVWLGYICGESCVLIIISIIVFIKAENCRITLENFAMLPKDFGE